MTAFLFSRPSFLQSPEWEQFQHTLGRKTWRAAGALVIRHDLLLGLHYLYAPRPRMGIGVLDDIATIAAQEKSIFFKIDPSDILPPTAYNLQPSISIQPRETIIIDLVKSEEELLAAMHEKTRYNIRLAERKGVHIKDFQCSIFNVQSEKFGIFWSILQETAERDGFRTHPREYYEKLLAVRSDNFSNELFFAEYRGEALAAAMINFYRGETSIGGVASYLHGASAREQREAMAPHLLHWRIMQEAKRRGCAAYDLWGVDEKRWPGLTRFKRGFGGRALVHPVSVDMIYRAGWYRLYSSWKRFSQK